MKKCQDPELEHQQGHEEQEHEDRENYEKLLKEGASNFFGYPIPLDWYYVGGVAPELRLQRMILRPDHWLPLNGSGDGVTYERSVPQALLTSILREGMATSLTEKQREALRLHGLKDLTYEAAAKRLGAKEGAKVKRKAEALRDQYDSGVAKLRKICHQRLDQRLRAIELSKPHAPDSESPDPGEPSDVGNEEQAVTLGGFARLVTSTGDGHADGCEIVRCGSASLEGWFVPEFPPEEFVERIYNIREVFRWKNVIAATAGIPGDATVPDSSNWAEEERQILHQDWRWDSRDGSRYGIEEEGQSRSQGDLQEALRDCSLAGADPEAGGDDDQVEQPALKGLANT